MIWHSDKKFEESILSIKFSGEGLDQHGVSIYDLSECLLSIQRIIHKAYLAKEDKLYKGAYPKKEIREKLALQLGERRKGSDLFGLVPLLDPESVNNILRQCIDYTISGVIGYYVGDLLKRIHDEKNDNRKIFMGSIYPEISNIVNRVDTIGGIEAISIGSPLLGRETVAAFDSTTKDYLNSIKDEYWLGKYQEIQGSVYKLYPNSNMVGIRRAGGSTVTIWLRPEDFAKIRYLKASDPFFIFKGRPKYKLGIETKKITEFEADEIEYIGNELIEKI